jgi:hypothetical protein
MRILALSIFASLLWTTAALSQSIDVASKKAGEVPLYRPALIGNGPDSLINQIDEKGLLKQGQKDALIMFCCTVSGTGDVLWSGTFRGTPGSQLLEQEVQKRLTGLKMVPGIYNHHPVDAIYYGTVVFAIVEGKPHLRIFSNQEDEEIKKESDFIDPQIFIGPESGFIGLKYPEEASAPVLVKGVVAAKLKIDAEGNLEKLQVTGEEPPFLGFKTAAEKDLGYARFIPAFRGGKPVACEVTLPFFYHPVR